ncbi:hypothetical protein MRBLMC3_002929 [Sphingobium sp. LMC3-1-1.1]|uniref:hypothetical protein n=1 Tax=Sphingobium sp. LMC3-1-1.1 TaxID=3135241 RepID=UPI00342FC9AF
MPDPGAGTSLGEAGGQVAGALAILYAVGKAFAWIINWRDTREQTRAAKMQAWHDELKSREDALDRKIEDRMASFEHQVGELTRVVDKWRLAFHLVAAELLQRDPQSKALLQAQRILSEAFPLNLAVPEDMVETLGQLDVARGSGR